jgi:hypothetical protein
MNKMTTSSPSLLSLIRNPPPISIEEEEWENEEDYHDYQRETNLLKIQKYIDCNKKLKWMIEHLGEHELEEALYEKDCYGCTSLHYACRFNMKKVALTIIQYTSKESNLYTVSNSETTPLLACCRRGKLQMVFDKIIEKTTNEDNLYLGKNTCLQFCILNGDVKKAMAILYKTHREENLYKLGFRFTSLLFSLENKLFEIAKYIIDKTQCERNLYIPCQGYPRLMQTVPMPMQHINAFSYLKLPQYSSVQTHLFKKYASINGHSAIKIRKIFHDNVNRLHSADLINIIASFLYYRV